MKRDVDKNRDVELEDLEALEDAGEMQVTVTGQEETTPLAGATAVTFEWAYGKRFERGWAEHTMGYAHRVPITVVTPRGRITLAHGRFRTFLQPVFEHSYAAGETGEVPDAVRDVLKDNPGGVDVAEYALQPGRAYHARVHADVFHLPPPGPGAPPRKGRKLVLWLSDAPFKDGKPEAPVTPSYQGWSY